MKEIIYLEPEFKSMIWGGSKFSSEFGFDIPNDHTGECWAISAHKNGDCTVKTGRYQGKKLSWLWDNHRELFDNMEGEVYPLLVKIIDAKDDLSIQVHPNDTYAKKTESGALGKTECWYVLDCDEAGEIIIGHNAKDKQELKEMIDSDRWDELIRVRQISIGDFFQIEPGTVHAIKKGTLILETQQNSDITYRLYDYGRLDHGQPRELHIEKSIDVIRCPYTDIEPEGIEVQSSNYQLKVLVQCDYYTVEKLNLNGEAEFIQDQKFRNCTVINGQGSIDGHQLKKGDSFILPADYGQYRLSGEMEIILSYPQT